MTESNSELMASIEAAPLFAVLPFALLLLAIAALPLLAHEFWERQLNKALVVAVLTLPVLVWLSFIAPLAVLHSLHEYVAFLSLLASLFVVSGGIHVSGDLRATPGHNCLVLGAGSVLANLFGTTGASMLLIRFLLRTNAQRKHTGHLPFFFILIVSNCGGMLTPLGDPPLFLGYLRGVPFTWTIHLLPFWLVAVGWLLLLFFVIDRRAYAREAVADLALDATAIRPLGIVGWRNVPLLFGIVAAVFLPTPLRELAMLAVGLASFFGSPKHVHDKNAFEFGPIIEVAVLFVGIFITMVPALELLKAHATMLGLSEPWQFFLGTGALSGVLDNAPTYLAFVSAAQGLALPGEVLSVPHHFLEAISAGAVLMGANTYVGNGPNFMVKAIADRAGYKTASFVRHALVALLVLSPVYLFSVLWVSR